MTHSGLSSVYACKACGYSSTNRAGWCDLGCGRDYNEMIPLPDSVRRQIDKLQAALDTGGPLGPPPTSTPGESGEGGGAGAGLDLDQLEAERWFVISPVVGKFREKTEDVLALVERVRKLEAVAEAADRLSKADAGLLLIEMEQSDDPAEARREYARCMYALDRALAAAGGGAHE